VTPEQIALVEETIAVLAPSLDDVADEFYRRLFAADPAVRKLFTTDLATQRTKFAAELAEIMGALRHHDVFLERAETLGGNHRGYGVTAAHYRTVGVALLGALARALGEMWTTDVEDAWRLAYNLTAEAMMAGAASAPVR
jgi:hemoglobin-like flavoprotein